jgi:hypothetical protein
MTRTVVWSSATATLNLAAIDPTGLEVTIARKIEQGEHPVHSRSRLSHILQRQQANVGAYRWAEFGPGDLDSWHLGEPLPSPPEQLDELIVWNN